MGEELDSMDVRINPQSDIYLTHQSGNITLFGVNRAANHIVSVDLNVKVARLRKRDLTNSEPKIGLKLTMKVRPEKIRTWISTSSTSCSFHIRSGENWWTLKKEEIDIICLKHPRDQNDVQNFFRRSIEDFPVQLWENVQICGRRLTEIVNKWYEIG